MLIFFCVEFLVYLQNSSPSFICVQYTRIRRLRSHKTIRKSTVPVYICTFGTISVLTEREKDRVSLENTRDIDENGLKQVLRGEHNGGRGGHGDLRRVDARPRRQLGVHAGCIDDQLLRNIHPGPGVDGERCVGEVNYKRENGFTLPSHYSENLLGDQNDLKRALLDDELPLQPRQALEYFVMRFGRRLLRR